jgi:hypothetical protein
MHWLIEVKPARTRIAYKNCINPKDTICDDFRKDINVSLIS